jgi:hypothetical protein
MCRCRSKPVRQTWRAENIEPSLAKFRKTARVSQTITKKAKPPQKEDRASPKGVSEILGVEPNGQ